ncbi:MAG: FAD-dependent oxidoreductase [Sulfuritalea sp.]|nr:FAD-dependent oxidoreductase [Sulfuritalea sp.]
MKQLVLVGGGHAHVQVLAALAAQAIAGTEVTLVTPFARQIYSGMLPGWIAGHYALDDCALPLDALTQQAGMRLLLTSCSEIDLAARRLHCTNGDSLAFDAISIDSGPVAAIDRLPGAAEHALAIRPIEGFVAAWPGLLDRARQGSFTLAIVGDGAAAIELALALQTRFAAEGLADCAITVIGSDPQPLPGLPFLLRRRAARLLAERGIGYRGGKRVAALHERQVELADGSRHATDAVLLATGAAAPHWPAAAGLAVDGGGFIRVAATLQSISHPCVFAAGDIAAYAEARPKSGVFAVRAGPPLAANLRAWCEGSRLQPWRPQRRALYLLSTGDDRALAAWGPFSAAGAWVWRWKDRIDRGFVARYGAHARAARQGVA